MVDLLKMHKVANNKDKATIMRLIRKTEFNILKDDSEYFIENYVHIEDRDSPDIATLFKMWENQKKTLKDFLYHRLNIILKARQLGLTWLALAFAAWNIVFNPGYAVVALSKREEDAKELVRRVTFILRYLPDWLIKEDSKDNIKWQGIKWSSTVMEVRISHPKREESYFKSMSAAPDSGRSFTANLVIIDEWAFQQWAEEIWSSAYPTINRPNGGKVIGLSTAKRLTLFEDIYRKSKAKKNTFNSIFLSWETDPRRTQEWYEQTKKDLPNSYKAEYPSTWEEAFAASQGIAFEKFTTDIHVIEPFEIPENWYRWRSVDNGYSDPYAWYWYAVDHDGIVYVYREFVRDIEKDPKISYSDQARKVCKFTKNERVRYTVAGHDAWNIHHLTKTATAPQGKSIIDYYGEGGVKNCVRAITDRKLRKATIMEYLEPYFDTNIEKTVSKIRIFNTCEKLIEDIPKMLDDEKDPDKYAECEFDHCVTGDTIIDTTNGQINIRDLVGKNGKVHCYDLDNGINTISNFSNVKLTRRNQKIFKITLEDGRIIKATDEHPVLTKEGWKQLKELTNEDYIVDILDHI